MSKNALIKPYLDSDMYIRTNGSIIFENDQSMDGNTLVNLEEGTELTDAINKSQLDTKVNTDHTIATHNLDTSATGGELNTLTDGILSNADALHKHDQYILPNSLTTSFGNNMSGYQEFPYDVQYQYGRSILFLADDPDHNTMTLTFAQSFAHSCRQVIPMVVNESCTTDGLDETEIFVGINCMNTTNVTLSWNRVSGASDPEFLIYLQYFAIGY